MQIIFIHSHRFRKINGEIYSLGGLANKVLERYTKYCDKLIVVARIMNENKTQSTYSKITDPKVEIYDINEINLEGLKKHIQESDFAILRFPCIIGSIAIKYVKKYKKKYIIEVVGDAWAALWNHGIKGKILAPFIELLMKYNVKKAENVIYVSKKFLPEKYPNNNNYVSCSDVELNETNEDILKNRMDKIQETDEKNKQIVIGTIGAINVKYKGQKYVIKAIQKLKKEGFNITYKIVGSGDKSFLENYARKCNVIDYIKFEGSLEHSKIFSFLDDIDIYIQPSNLEGLCRALVEAMSRGCPCIASNVGGNPELIDEKYIFKKKNVRDLQAKIKQLIQKEELINQAERNFKNSKKYSKECLNKKRNMFYSNIIKK